MVMSGEEFKFTREVNHFREKRRVMGCNNGRNIGEVNRRKKHGLNPLMNGGGVY